MSSYDVFNDILLDASLSLETDTLNIALVDSTYTFDSTNTNFSTDIAGSELPTGDGYTAGGETLTNSSVDLVTGLAYWSADNVTWSALTATFRGAVIYASGTIGAYTDPPLIYILFDDTPDDIVVTAFDFTITWNASGIMSLS